MTYLQIKADRIFDGRQLLQDHRMVLRKDGTVEDLLPDNGDDTAVRYKGILIPGLINCHCHLELSHLKNVIRPGTGLVPFLISVVQRRSETEDVKQQHIRAAEMEMQRNGIVAVADICNTIDALQVKQQSTIWWHSLVEVLNFFDENLEKAIANYGTVADVHGMHHLSSVLTPHAPYTVSPKTLAHLNATTAGKIISMHNQETAAEDELFLSGKGAFLQLYDTFSQGRVPVGNTGRTSLQSWLPFFTNGQTILLVHNTFTTEADIVFAEKHAAQYGLNIIYCLCPNANMYIEGRMPPIELFLKHNVPVVVGTDSYSSNRQLDIMSELRTIKQHYPQLALELLLQWATSNGAAALQQEQLGSFVKGKKPGVLLLQEEELTVQRLY